MAGSTLAARALGRQLALYRTRAGLTRYAAAQVVETSQQTLSRIEDGLKAKVPDLWINALADAFSCSDQERRILLGLAHELRTAQQNWWRGYADQLNPGFDHLLGLEEAARKLSSWRVTAVPGLLQTTEYRRAIAWTESPEMTTEQVDRRLELATRRQTRWQDETFIMDVILSEYVLRDQIGGPAVMADQLRRLADVGQLPNISIRVVPFDAAGHLGSLVGTFVLLEFPKLPATGLAEPPVVFVEGYAGDLYLEREAEVKRYRDALSEISRVALDPDTTRRLLLSIVKEYGQ